MNNRKLNARDNVVRYASFTHIYSGKVGGSAFRPKPTGKDLSVNWLECFEDQDKDEQLNTIRGLIRRKLGTQGKLAELNVGKTIKDFTSEVANYNAKNADKKPICCKLQFTNTPLCESDEHPADPSHCDVFTLPAPDPIHLDIIGDFIAKSVTRLHPAKLKS